MKFFKLRWTSVLFYIALVVIIAAGMTAVLLLQKPVRDWLSDYEASQPKYEVQRIFEEYFEHPDAEKLISMSEDKPTFNAPDTFEDAVKRYADNIEGKKMTFGYVAGSDRRSVNIKADGKRVARFSIKPKEEKSKYGRELYELDRINLFFEDPVEFVSVSLPETFTAYAGGIEITEDHLVQSDVKDDPRDFVPEGAYFFKYKAYTLTGLYSEPVITVKDGVGNDVPLEYDEENRLYSCRYEYSEELKEKYSAYVLEAMKRYAIYMQDDARFKTVKDYLDPDTDLYTNIYENPNSFVWEHDGYFFENEQTSEFFDYGEAISCRVGFDHHLTKKGKEDYIDKCDYTLYLHMKDGEYKIYYMVTH